MRSAVGKVGRMGRDKVEGSQADLWHRELVPTRTSRRIAAVGLAAISVLWLALPSILLWRSWGPLAVGLFVLMLGTCFVLVPRRFPVAGVPGLCLCFIGIGWMLWREAQPGSGDLRALATSPGYSAMVAGMCQNLLMNTFSSIPRLWRGESARSADPV